MILDSLLYKSIVGGPQPVVLKNMEHNFQGEMKVRWSESSSEEDCEIKYSKEDKFSFSNNESKVQTKPFTKVVEPDTPTGSNSYTVTRPPSHLASSTQNPKNPSYES